MPISAIIIELEPLALSRAEAARSWPVSKRSPSRPIFEGKVEAQKHGPRTPVDVASLKAYYVGLPKKTDHAPIVFDRRAHVLPRTHA